MSEDKKIYLTNWARHHMLQRCWHNLHSGILRMPLSTKGKEDVEQNLRFHHHMLQHQTWPTHWMFIRKNASFLSMSGVSLQLRINPRHQGQDIIHKGCRDDGLTKVLLENTGLAQKAQGNANTWPCWWKAGGEKTAGNLVFFLLFSEIGLDPNDWIVGKPLLGSRTCWCQRCSSCNALWEEPELQLECN